MQKKRLRKYKKSSAVFIVLFIHLFICLFCGIGNKIAVYAKSDEEKQASTEEKLNESIFEQINELDLTALQEYLYSLHGFTDKSVSERLIEHIKGDKFDYENFGRQIGRVLFENVREILPAFACIAAVALLSGVISTLKSGSNAKTAGDMIFFITYAAALIPVIGVLTECFMQTKDTIAQMQTQMQLVFPLMLTLMAASGGSVTVAVCRPAVAYFSSTIVSVISAIVLPLTVTIIAFSMAGNLTKELKITKFTAFFKSINKWIIGICISAFGIFFTLQGITTATYDGIVRRAAKYAIGNGIPIVGGFLSGGFDLAVAGSVLIKNSLGSLSIFMMVAILFEPLLLLIAVNLLLRFTSAITQPFGDSRISDFLSETAENLRYCTAGLLFTAFMYFLSIMLLVTATEAIL